MTKANSTNGDDQSIPNSLPENIVCADDIWRDFESRLPSGTSPDVRTSLERDCRRMLERLLDPTGMQTHHEFHGERNPNVVKKIIEEVVHTACNQLVGRLASELMVIRFEMALLRSRVSSIDGQN